MSKSLKETEERELSELRDWMVTNIRGLKDDRSTASYALEFLRTTHRNLLLYHARMSLQIMVGDCRKIAERVPEAMSRALELEKDQCVIPWNTERNSL